MTRNFIRTDGPNQPDTGLTITGDRAPPRLLQAEVRARQAEYPAPSTRSAAKQELAGVNMAKPKPISKAPSKITAKLPPSQAKNSPVAPSKKDREIGRASCRERV